MTSSSTGYRSPVNLTIGRVPLTTDPELFDELTDVYNAIHILNQYLDRLRIIASGGGDGTTPDTTVPFNRFFNAPAILPITKGMTVRPGSGSDGVVPGIVVSPNTTGRVVCNFSAVALNDAAVGEPVRVGVGPAVLAVPGAVAGQSVFGVSGIALNGSYFNNGNIYLSDPGTVAGGGTSALSAPVGVCIQNGYVLFGQLLWR